MEALRALLLSDAVLTGVVQDLNITEPKARAEKLQQLRETVRLEGDGGAFVEIFHSGPNPVGLGQELRTVILRFLDALVPDQSRPDAVTLLAEKHQRDLASQELLKTQLEAKLASSTSAGTETDIAKLAGNGGQFEAARAQQQKTIADRDQVQRELAALESKIQATRAQLEVTQQRLRSVRLASAQGVLRAPELIRMIDPPRDPEFPTRSARIYLLASLAAGALLGIALASISEFLDTSLRTPEEFADAVGAPVIARIGRAGAALS
ncbi:hypothetical protein SAZ10_15085 [Mesorhizobium sp. BAC0120]|uniref:hypothetical protein n=1 Tax=Mesorhizobium sp. BAC0120 TaxID=3090670 RepID=UPI00298D0A40|nr:hypothetical protein [Mesorhizobium sp. BAC0120]MDW6023084.1 hypothetical protein [Mesorhizobium sp. BAC0120]